MKSYKDSKMMNIISEFLVEEGVTEYNINGTDLGRAVFFWRRYQQIFETIPLADFTVIDDTATSGNITLRIDNTAQLALMHEFQICYEDTTLTSKYITSNPDIAILKDKFNLAVDDITVLWTSLENLGFKADTKKLSVIFPELNDGESPVWSGAEQKFYGVQVADLQLEADRKKAQITDHANNEKNSITEYFNNEKNDFTNEVETDIKPEVVAHGEGEMDDHLDTVIKPQMVAHRDNLEADMTTHNDGLKAQLDDKFSDMKHDNGVAPAGSDIRTLAYGRWWTTDIKTLINYPEGEKVLAGTLDIDKSNNLRLIRFYDTSGLVYFCHETTSGGWTDWFSMSGEDNNAIPVGQLGGEEYKFAPVVWDNDTHQYTLATDETGAEAVAVNCDTTEGVVILSSRVKVPVGARDSDGLLLEDGHWYFLAQAPHAGKFEKTKPATGIWQVLMFVSDYDGELYAVISVGEAEDLTPFVYDSDGTTTAMATKGYVDSQRNYEGYRVLNKTTKPNELKQGYTVYLSSSDEGWTSEVSRLGSSLFLTIECVRQYSSTLTGAYQIVRPYKPNDEASRGVYGIRYGTEDTWEDFIYVDESVLDKDRLVYGDSGRAKSSYLTKTLDIKESGFYAYQQVDDPDAPPSTSGYMLATAYSSDSIGLLFITAGGLYQSRKYSGGVDTWRRVYTDTYHPADDSGWKYPNLSDGWENYGGDWGSLRYKKYNGVVFVEGLVRCDNATGQTIATLPSGYRIGRPILTHAYANFNGGTSTRLDVDETGRIKCQAYANGGYVGISLQWIAEL